MPEQQPPPQPPQPPQPVPLHLRPSFTIFVGPIQYPATKSLRNHFSWLVQQGYTETTLLFSSWGGSLMDGFSIYHFFRSLPMELTIWNIGSVESIANIIFLGGSKRFACPGTYFKLHNFDWTFTAQTFEHEKIKEFALSLDTDKERYLEILKERTAITDADIARLDFFNKGTIIQAAGAKDFGIVQEVKQALMPQGSMAWNIEY